MNKTLSTQQIRLVMVLGVLALAVMAWAFLANRQTSQTPTLAAPTHVKPVHHATRTRHATPTHHARPVHHAKRSAHATKLHTAAPLKIHRHGLPLKVATALTKHRIVVVALSMPGAALDELALRESEAGAKATNVGFVSLNVAKQREGGPLLTKLGVTDPPAVLVMRRHGSSVFAKLRGFVDRETVEQAVADARR